MGLFSRRQKPLDKKRRIFFVEDNLIYARQLEYFLKSKFKGKAEITHFHIAEVMEVKLETGTIPDVIIMDHFLNNSYAGAEPGLNVLKRICGLYPGIHLVLHTSNESVEFIIDSLSGGICDYVPKGAQSMEKLETLINKTIK